MYKNVIFREYDIRGVYNGEFDKDFAYLLGKSYCQYLFTKKGISNPTVVLGHDARLSSPEIKESLSRGLTECGARVLYIGLVTSPISYFATFEVPGVHGALMITGSHNPPEYNGFKISVGKGTIFGDDIQELRRIMEKGVFPSGRGHEEPFDIFPTYVDKNRREFGDLSGVKVVLDCGNGAAGCIVKKLFESVGLKPTILFEKPDGNFPNHHPDPTVEKNLIDLVAQVKKEGATVGIGFDGDADRIGIVDHTGGMVYGDELMVIISRDILSTGKGGKIIGDVKCSDRLYDDIKKFGGEPIMWKTGHSLIKEKIKIEKAPFGGEMSGHIFFNDRNYGYDDAMYAALRLCEIIKRSGKTIPQLLEGLPSAFNTPELRIDTTEEKKVLIVEKLKEAFKGGPGADYSLNLIDGVRISFEDGWALARSSNTQPVLVLRFESSTEDGLKKIQDRVYQVVNRYL
ncbi:MAG: phosphomannomutase/phosphoglucomutase [Proteobacteria bacterium]|jgi:phosphomannomutase/phosphomannomutase/phosphoglucomutase|nr:phosphomannomutase/phosphoglucomutase [Pseudomonadota bacterium]